MTSQLDTLTQINLDDLVSSFGWENKSLLASLVRRTFVNPARKFAEQMVDFDSSVGRTSLGDAARNILRKHYVSDVRVHGYSNIPASGPTLFLSNHPGIADNLSLFAVIHRSDLKTIAQHRPFLASLVNTAQQLIFIDDNSARRMQAVRQVATHLRNGGAALTFPAGGIEPDPLVYPGALESLNHWTDSAGVFIRFAPETKIVPVLVSGVIWEKTAQHWIPRLKRSRFEREKLAAALQLLMMVTRNVRATTAHIQFAKPITVEEVGSTDAQAIHRVVIERMKSLIQNPPMDEGVSALQPHETTLSNVSKKPSTESVY